MSLHLEEISSQVTQGSHAVLLLDGAGWHQTGGKLRVPGNISLLHLPAYSPELNPVENIWQFLRQNHLSNRVFENYDEILDACCAAWNALTAEVKAHRLNRHTSLGVGCCLMPLVLSLAALKDLLGARKSARGDAPVKAAHRMAPCPPNRPKVSDDGLLTAAQVFEALSEIRPANAVLVEESPSNLADLHACWPITKPASFFTFASGGLGWNLPASVGIALAERDTSRHRPVIVIIGDGSFQYSVQSIWTAAQHHLPILFVVLSNGEYCILKSFAELEEAPGVPGLDIPGIDVVSLAKGYGCDGVRLDDFDAIKSAAVEAWTKSKPTVLEIPISPQVPPLI